MSFFVKHRRAACLMCRINSICIDHVRSLCRFVWLGFASKVMGHVRFGFAAGCEAGAMPRRRGALYMLGLCPWRGLWPNKVKD